jgi:hypothetical protein
MLGVIAFKRVTAELYPVGQEAHIELSMHVKVEPVRVTDRVLESERVDIETKEPRAWDLKPIN